MRTKWLVLVWVLLLLLPFVAAQFTLTLDDPVGNKVPGYVATCGNNVWCTIDPTEARKACLYEGMYTYIFDIGPGHSPQQLPLDSHNTNWDTAEWCQGTENEDYTCFVDKSVDFFDFGKSVAVAATDPVCYPGEGCEVAGFFMFGHWNNDNSVFRPPGIDDEGNDIDTLPPDWPEMMLDTYPGPSPVYEDILIKAYYEEDVLQGGPFDQGAYDTWLAGLDAASHNLYMTQKLQEDVSELQLLEAEGVLYYSLCPTPSTQTCQVWQGAECTAWQWQGVDADPYPFPFGATQSVFETWRTNGDHDGRGYCGAGTGTGKPQYYWWYANKICGSDPICLAGMPATVDALGRCCGARPAENCGEMISVTPPGYAGSVTRLCGEVDYATWKWGDLVEDAGDIYNYMCANASAMSDGHEFYGCGDTGQLTSFLPDLEMVRVSRGGGDPHGYVCAELAADSDEGYQSIVECAGGGARQSTTVSDYARTGERFSPDLLYGRIFSSADSVKVQPQYNIEPNEGRIEMFITPEWDSADSNDRTFFQIYESPSALITFKRNGIAKELECIYQADGQQTKLSFAKDIVDGERFYVKVEWQAGTTFECRVDKEIQSGGAPRQLKPTAIVVADHKNSGESAGAEIEFNLYGSRTPTTYYCGYDKLFYDDLDNLGTVGELTCNNAGALYGNHFWTGSLCCSEADDPFEYYNDIGGNGGCWNGAPFPNGDRIDEPGNHNRTLVSHGQWFGCNLLGDAEGQAIYDDNSDRHTGQRLVSNNQTCDVFTDVGASDVEGYVCSNLGNQWQRAQSLEPHILQSVHQDMSAAGTASAQECCGQTSCWSGQQPCVVDQTYDTRDITYEGFRCLVGQWGVQDRKETWSRQYGGYCAEPTDCLVLPTDDADQYGNASGYIRGNNDDPQPGSPSCVNNHNYVMQYQCMDGDWGTRSLSLGLQLLDYAADSSGANVQDYALFCDSWDNILNFVDYQALPNAGQVTDYVSKEDCMLNGQQIPCHNNFCALRFESGGREQVAFGVSLNTDVSSSTEGILPALGFDSDVCDGAKNANGKYDQCSNRLWYNHDMNTLLWLPVGSPRAADYASIRADNMGALNAHMNNLVAFSSGTAGSTVRPFTGFFSESSLYDTFYLAKKGGKDYFGYLGERQFNGSSNPLHYIAIDHRGFTVQGVGGSAPCDLVLQTIQQGSLAGAIDVAYDCDYDGTVFNYLGYSTGTASNKDLLSRLWLDLSAKLRP
ncbi:MAG: hypothetical protein ACE5FT_02670 [Candidatus Nanoarchaeia archaeon]